MSVYVFFTDNNTFCLIYFSLSVKSWERFNASPGILHTLCSCQQNSFQSHKGLSVSYTDNVMKGAKSQLPS